MKNCSTVEKFLCDMNGNDEKWVVYGTGTKKETFCAPKIVNWNLLSRSA